MLYVVFLSAKVVEKIADCLSLEDKIVCYLSFLLYIMIFSTLMLLRYFMIIFREYVVHGYLYGWKLLFELGLGLFFTPFLLDFTLCIPYIFSILHW